MVSDPYGHSTYLLKRKPWMLAGGVFTVLDPYGNTAFFCRMKPFKLREDLRVYSGEDMRQEVLRIQARQIFDFGATYDVFDAPAAEHLGSFRRQGFRSMMRDTWQILNPQGEEAGVVREDTENLALARRFLTNLIPQTFYVIARGGIVAEYSQNFNPFYLKLTCDFSMDLRRLLDRRMGISAALLLAAVERRQR